MDANLPDPGKKAFASGKTVSQPKGTTKEALAARKASAKALALAIHTPADDDENSLGEALAETEQSKFLATNPPRLPISPLNSFQI